MAPKPRKTRPAKRKPKSQPAALKVLKQIAEFLAQPIAVAQRWGKTGMPITRGGRQITASPEQLSCGWDESQERLAPLTS